MAADGSIVIDTKIPTGGFNTGMKKLQSSAAGALNSVLFAAIKVGSAARGAIDKVVKIAGSVATILKRVLLTGLLILGASIAAVFRGLRESLENIISANLAGS